MTSCNYPSTPSPSPLLTLISLSQSNEPETTIIGISFYTESLISSVTSKSASPINILTILHRLTPSARFFPYAIFIHKSILKAVYPPHDKSFYGLSKIKIMNY